ncbi:MAG TPA: ThuA domain-containing protein [Pirellulales bacterium]|nr:ThuA domain-containing protein [Pirellulales bacterium]
MLHRRQLLVSAGLGLGLSPLLIARASEPQPRKRRVLMFTKSASFEHSVIKRQGDQLSHAERTLTEFGGSHGFEVTATKDGTIFDSDLAPYDAFFFYTTGDLTKPGKDMQPPMSAAGKDRLLAAVAGGKGFLASHCGSDTFHSDGPAFEEQSKLDPYIAMLGGEFIKHGPQQKARQVIIDGKFPGLDGLGKSFEMNDEWYSLKNFAPDLHVILLQDTQGMTGGEYQRPAYPSTWARRHGSGRVFYTSMGHREDVWTNPVFQQIVLGGLAWATGNVEADVAANIAEAAPGAHVMPPLPMPKPKKG